VSSDPQSANSVQRGLGRGALLAATARVVERGGMRELTYRNVAREAGVTHGLVRHYFGSRDALIKAALEQSVSVSIENSGLGADIDDLDMLARDLPASIEADPGGQVFQYELILQSTRQPDLKLDVMKLHELYRQTMEEELAKVGLGGDADLANLVFAALDGLVFEQVALGDAAVTERALDKLRAVLRAYRATLSD
jgi:DNA-binding transcriptional regulator YbjK